MAGVIRIRKIHPGARLPERREGDIGWDLFAHTVEPLADNMVKVGTGLSLELPPGYWAQIENRSSMGKAGWAVHGGIVDNAYRGEIIVVLAQHRPGAPAAIEPGAKIAQMIIRRQEDTGWSLEESEALSETGRGSGGFGSTGQ